MARNTAKKDAVKQQSKETPAMAQNEKSSANKKMGKSNVPSSTAASSQSKKKTSTIMASSGNSLAKQRSQSLPTLIPPSLQNKKINRSMSEPNRQTTSQANRNQQSQNIPIASKLNKRFYEALVMLAIMGKTRGDRIEEESHQSDPPLSSLNSELLRRRSFIKHLAYLCDHESGGDRTTAIALQSTPQGLVYWFASNRSPEGKDKTAEFMKYVLRSLKGLDGVDDEELERQLFGQAVKFSQKRISNYVKVLKPDVDIVMKGLLKSNLTKDSGMISWLQRLKDSIPSASRICRLCYDSRHCEEYESLHIRAIPPAPLSDRFETIRHVVGRLNHTMKAVKDVVAARKCLPVMISEDFAVVRVKSAARSPPPLEQRNPTLSSIAGRMLSRPSDISLYREALEDLDSKFGLSKRLSHHCTSLDWKPKVHAKLLILDHFWTHDLEFVDRDRYIACSKPACFCCYQYIVAHPGNFVKPPSSNNCHLKWKAPDISESLRQDTREDLVKIRENILNEMTKKIRQEVLDQIRERRGPRSSRPDSLTEISSICMEKLTPRHELEEESEAEGASSSDDLRSDRSDVCDGGYGTCCDDQSVEEDGDFDEEDDSDSGDNDDEGGVLLDLQ